MQAAAAVCPCRTVELVERRPGEWLIRPLDELCDDCRRGLASAPADWTPPPRGPVRIDVECVDPAGHGPVTWTALRRDVPSRSVPANAPVGPAPDGVVDLVLERARLAGPGEAVVTLPPRAFDRLVRHWTRDDCTGLAALADVLDRVNDTVRLAVAHGTSVGLTLTGVPAPLADLLGAVLAGLVVRHFLTPLTSLAGLLRIAGVLLCAAATADAAGCPCAPGLDPQELRRRPTFGVAVELAPPSLPTPSPVRRTIAALPAAPAEPPRAAEPPLGPPGTPWSEPPGLSAS